MASEGESDETRNVESSNNGDIIDNQKDVEIDKGVETGAEEIKECNDSDEIVEVKESEEEEEEEKNDEAHHLQTRSISSSVSLALKEFERKPLLGLRSKLEDAILGNKIFKEEEEEKTDGERPVKVEEAVPGNKTLKEEEKPDGDKPEAIPVNKILKEEEKTDGDKPEKVEEAVPGNKILKEEEKTDDDKPVKVEEASPGNNVLKEEGKSDGDKPALDGKDGERATDDLDKKKKEASSSSSSGASSSSSDEEEEEHNEPEKTCDEAKKDDGVVIKEKKRVEVDKDISLWGVPLLPSKGDERTDVVLFKFLKARDLYVSETFTMLKNTLKWRKDNNIDSILDEDFDFDSDYAAYMEGKDRSGLPVCYNVFGVLNDDSKYEKMLGSEEKRQKFLRWRIQLMERGIKQLDFKPGPEGKSTILQINDLKLTPGITKKELRQITTKAVELLQDNYPEMVSKNIFINVPFWYYAFSAVFSPFFTQTTKDKFIYARSARVIDTLIKYIPGEEIPVRYGGLKRKGDEEFSVEDRAKEVTLRSGATEMIEIPLEEVGRTLVWDLSVGGWEVEYKEEFVPTDDKSYTLIVQKGRKMTWEEEPVRNSFRNKEPGKLVITIANSSYKRKVVLYRYKIHN